MRVRTGPADCIERRERPSGNGKRGIDDTCALLLALRHAGTVAGCAALGRSGAGSRGRSCRKGVRRGGAGVSAARGLLEPLYLRGRTSGGPAGDAGADRGGAGQPQPRPPAVGSGRHGQPHAGRQGPSREPWMMPGGRVVLPAGHGTGRSGGAHCAGGSAARRRSARNRLPARRTGVGAGAGRPGDGARPGSPPGGAVAAAAGGAGPRTARDARRNSTASRRTIRP
jgi:hypothetical protein